MAKQKYYKYTTRSGDTFDLLAIGFYNEEKLASTIIEANPRYCGTVVFDAGVVLKIPVINKNTNVTPKSIAPWRR